MPGTTEPTQLQCGVSVGNDGIWWYYANMTPNTVLSQSIESVEYDIEDTELFYEAGTANG